MMQNSKKWLTAFGVMWMIALMIAVLPAAAEEQVHVATDIEISGDLGLLLGDGNGLTADYLSRPTTRLQAAIMMLRLTGLENKALSFQGSGNFSDAALVNADNRAILAYLHANPQLGWEGIAEGKFDPLAGITAQQFYKVILETLGYRAGLDFEYVNMLAFASSKGLFKIAGVSEFKNLDIATATVEALKIQRKDSEQTLLAMLAEQHIIDPAKVDMLNGARVDIASQMSVGHYLVDGNGMALYYFATDAANQNSCQGQCLVNWPIFYSEHLQLDSGLSKADFTAFAREDGQKQLAYKGWPLYYYIGDTAPGVIRGENVGKAWFVMKQPFYSLMIAKTELGRFLSDETGNTLYYFAKDTADTSNCSGACLNLWPAFHAADIIVPTGVNAADFGEITRADGTKQTTFKGSPLYYFKNDLNRGETTGQGFNDIWFVVNLETFSSSKVQEPEARTYSIDIKDFSFGPPITIEVGASVTFTNQDNVEHNAAAEDGSFTTPLLKKGESYTVKFEQAGVYDYFCEPHKAIMQGKITVR